MFVLVPSVFLVVKSNLEDYIHKALSLADIVRNKALRYKCQVKRILPGFYYHKKREIFQHHLEINYNEDEDLSSNQSYCFCVNKDDIETTIFDNFLLE